MSEHKTPTETLQEIDYEISKILSENGLLMERLDFNKERLQLLNDRKQSLLNYLNTDSGSINQDKTE